jgi:hypothetical protein
MLHSMGLGLPTQTHIAWAWHSQDNLYIQLSLQLFTYLCLYPINGPKIAMIKELMDFGTWF